MAIVFTGISAVTKNLDARYDNGATSRHYGCPQVAVCCGSRHRIMIRACAGMMTSGLLLPMVAIISIDEFQALSKDNAEFTAIDAQPQVDLAAADDGVKQV